ncbi:MAG: hypothetical protein GX112_14945 [Clostridiaceae bacterium]|jgi:5-methyltetrahydrofolate--homocysteine methyltransferase|nr:hypothetical protein [Clostridiaceae bacterium]
MKKQDLWQLLEQNALLLDGATGTRLQQAGMPTGVCPETWVLEHPDVLTSLQLSYLNAGSSIVYAFTFGANRTKLTRHQVPPSQTEAINRQLALISIAARDAFRKAHPERMVQVAGDLAPTGLFLKPAGDLDFEDLVAIYREQVRGQLAAGVDLFVVETMMDLAQTRAAVLAVQAECQHPVLASMTVAENGRTLSGDTVQACMLTLASLGVAAFGLNCSFGPEKMLELMRPLGELSPVPLLLKPNAGLPQLINGRTEFPMGPEDFAAAMAAAIPGGIRLLGGCCGTGPRHIAALNRKRSAQHAPAIAHPSDCGNWICATRSCVQLDNPSPLPVLKADDWDSLPDQAMDAQDDEPPALVLDCSGLAPDARPDLSDLQAMSPLPLVFSGCRGDLLSHLLRQYHGRAAVWTDEPHVPYGALRLPATGR